MISLKTRLQKGEVTIGSWITLGHPSIVEIMAKSGFDWLTIDMEHSAIGMQEAQQLIQVIELCGVTPLVRVGENNPNIIKRVMDAGAHGVIVPMVNTKEDAIKAVNAVKYPPVGTRGVGLGRAQGYGMEFDKYKEWESKESVVIVQIEHIQAVENLEDILNVEGVDAFIVGPYDLSASIGKPGEFNDPEVMKQLDIVKKIAKKNNAVAGFHVIPPEAEELLMKVKEGYKFLAFSIDTLFLGQSCRRELNKTLNELKE